MYMSGTFINTPRILLTMFAIVRTSTPEKNSFVLCLVLCVSFSTPILKCETSGNQCKNSRKTDPDGTNSSGISEISRSDPAIAEDSSEYMLPSGSLSSTSSR